MVREIVDEDEDALITQVSIELLCPSKNAPETVGGFDVVGGRE